MLLRCESLEPPMSQMGPNSVVPVISAARPFFPRKRTSICDLAMSHSCQKRASAPAWFLIGKIATADSE
jgi:hypothetical protein